MLEYLPSLTSYFMHLFASKKTAVYLREEVQK
jgi:hypothetical protein